jgi:hypothetical protein
VKDGGNVSQRLQIERMESFKNNKYLVFDAKSNGLKKGDKINVGLCVNKEISPGQIRQILVWHTDNPDSTTRATITVPDIDTYTVQATPDYVPEQELTDGTKKAVGQLKFKLDVPSLVRNNNIARFYFNTDNVISTNWKDKSSKIEMKFGAERSLTRNWYVPGNLEAKVNGDQRFKNSTFIATGGVKTIIPWGWTRRALFNQLIRAPVSPEFGINAEFHHRLKQDVASKAKFPNKNSFALTGQFIWLPIQLFTKNCTDAEGNPNIDLCYSAKNISLELAAKGWWFPYEKTLAGTKVGKLEARAEISLLIPFPFINNISEKFAFKTENGGFASRLRFKYVTGANEAAGFKHSSQFTVGVELIK